MENDILAPPHKSAVALSSGVTLFVAQPIDEVEEILSSAYERKSPFVRLNDNYGRLVLVPVGTILLVTTPN